MLNPSALEFVYSLAFNVEFKNEWSTTSTPLCTWGVQVRRYPNFFFSGMEADRNVKVVGGDVAVL